jgi:hypothetical protein
MMPGSAKSWLITAPLLTLRFVNVGVESTVVAVAPRKVSNSDENISSELRIWSENLKETGDRIFSYGDYIGWTKLTSRIGRSMEHNHNTALEWGKIGNIAPRNIDLLLAVFGFQAVVSSYCWYSLPHL